MRRRAGEQTGAFRTITPVSGGAGHSGCRVPRPPDTGVVRGAESSGTSRGARPMRPTRTRWTCRRPEKAMRRPARRSRTPKPVRRRTRGGPAVVRPLPAPRRVVVEQRYDGQRSGHNRPGTRYCAHRDRAGTRASPRSGSTRTAPSNGSCKGPPFGRQANVQAKSVTRGSATNVYISPGFTSPSWHYRETFANARGLCIQYGSGCASSHSTVAAASASAAPCRHGTSPAGRRMRSPAASQE